MDKVQQVRKERINLKETFLNKKKRSTHRRHAYDDFRRGKRGNAGMEGGVQRLNLSLGDVAAAATVELAAVTGSAQTISAHRSKSLPVTALEEQ